jgi:hypothetical protein
MIIYNTTFFHTAATADDLRRWIGQRWMPLCDSYATAPSVCLAMDSPQPDVEVLAVHVYFDDLEQCENFASQVAPVEFANITRLLGAEGVTPFPTILREVKL